jgi:hypothetical protein
VLVNSEMLVMTLSISRIYRLSVLEVAHDRVMYVCSQRSEYACVYVSVCVYFMRFEKNTICMLEINIYQTSPNSTFHTHTHIYIYIMYSMLVMESMFGLFQLGLFQISLI